jgi:hypothetical protein
MTPETVAGSVGLAFGRDLFAARSTKSALERVGDANLVLPVNGHPVRIDRVAHDTPGEERYRARLPEGDGWFVVHRDGEGKPRLKKGGTVALNGAGEDEVEDLATDAIHTSRL